MVLTFHMSFNLKTRLVKLATGIEQNTGLGVVSFLDPNKINRAAFEQYSAKAVTAQLVEKLDLIVSSAAGRG